MSCRPIKIQRFDTQTSKFTRPFGNVSAPVTQMIVAGLFAVWQDMAFTKSNWLGRNFKQGVQSFKRQNARTCCWFCFQCEVFAEWRQTFQSGRVTFEVWLSKLWILIGRQNMFLASVWTGSCKRRYACPWELQFFIGSKFTSKLGENFLKFFRSVFRLLFVPVLSWTLIANRENMCCLSK